jgi:xanthine dehydrogenase accessory factor
MRADLPLLERLVDEVAAGRRVALCAVVETQGSTPQVPGSLMLVDEAGEILGTVGGGLVEAEALAEARRRLAHGPPAVVRFRLDEQSAADEGLLCGGSMGIAIVPITTLEAARPYRQAVADLRSGRGAVLELVVEQEEKLALYRVQVARAPTLLIAGAGHVGAELARLCSRLDFRVVVVDDRPELAHVDRLPPPIEMVVGDIEQTLREQPIDAASYVVIVTRGHRYDQRALLAVIDSDAHYIGMIGSRRKVELVRKHLIDCGVAPARLDRVHAPIGLPIGAVTVPELAVSIAAQLIEVRRRDRRPAVEGPVPIAGEGR